MNCNYLKLYSICKLVKGSKRALICDIQRNEWYLIPLDFYTFILKCRNKSISDIIEYYGSHNKEVIEEYIDFLLQNEFAFYCEKDELRLFPDITLSWDSPTEITNSILDFKLLEKSKLENLIYELDSLNCQNIQIRLFCKVDISEIISMIAKFIESQIMCFQLILPYYEEVENLSLSEIFFSHKRLTQIIFYSAPISKIDRIFEGMNSYVIYYKNNISSHFHCGIINTHWFSSNLSLFTESQHHNTCLNRKISIDTEGNIKNCPSMAQSFGNIKDTTLQEALAHPDFKKYWNITKDQISVCKDCEFRHICTDCRAYLENPEDIYSKPLKCGYNPYTCEWEDWSTHPLKQKAMEYYGLKEIASKT